MGGCCLGLSSWVDVEQMSDMKGKFPKHSCFTPPGQKPSLPAKAPRLFWAVVHLGISYKHNSDRGVTERADFTQAHIPTRNWHIKAGATLIPAPRPSILSVF